MSKKHVKVTMTVVEKDHGWKAIRAELERAKGSYAKVGLLDGGKNERSGDGLTNVELGIIHEFGAPKVGIPERPWLRGGIDYCSRELADLFERFGGLIMEGKLTVDRALGLIGVKAVAGIKAYVTGPGVPPPNAPATIAAKKAKGTSRGPVKALIDTARMIGGVAYEVVIGQR